MKKIVCFTNEADSKELLQKNNDLKFDFIKSFNDLPNADIYIISLKMATNIYSDFLNFMRNHPQSKFLFLEEYTNTLSDEDFDIREEPNTDIYMYTPKKAILIIMEEIKLSEEVEAKQLCSGIFWILSDCYDLSDYELLTFNIPCDPDGNPNNTHSIVLNSKSGNTYNHKKLWESEVKNNRKYRPYNKKSYDYYPRGRIEISNNRAVIYLNPHINKPDFIDIIKQNFGLFPCNISEVRIIADGSDHYQCFLDRG